VAVRRIFSALAPSTSNGSQLTVARGLLAVRFCGRYLR
jgi:hypothetical protein